MNDAIVYWIETTEEEVHFIDAIVSAYDSSSPPGWRTSSSN